MRFSLVQSYRITRTLPSVSQGVSSDVRGPHFRPYYPSFMIHKTKLRQQWDTHSEACGYTPHRTETKQKYRRNHKYRGAQ